MKIVGPISILILAGISLSAKDETYTLSLSTSIVNSKYTKSGQESHSDGYATMASLSKNFSNDTIATGILGYTDIDVAYDESGNDAKSNVRAHTYGLSLLKVLNPVQYLNLSVIYSDSGIAMNGTMNAAPVDASLNSSSLTSTIAFVQVVPINHNFFTSLNVSLSNQERKTDEYTTASSTTVPASRSTLTYATFGVAPTYNLDNGWSAGMNISYIHADKSFLAGEDDMNFYSAGFNITKKFNETWSARLNGYKQYGLRYSASDSIGLNAMIKF